MKQLFGDQELNLDIEKIKKTLVENMLRVHIASVERRLEACKRCPLITENPGGFKAQRSIDPVSKNRLQNYTHLHKGYPIAMWEPLKEKVNPTTDPIRKVTSWEEDQRKTNQAIADATAASLIENVPPPKTTEEFDGQNRREVIATRRSRETHEAELKKRAEEKRLAALNAETENAIVGADPRLQLMAIEQEGKEIEKKLSDNETAIDTLSEKIDELNEEHINRQDDEQVREELEGAQAKLATLKINRDELRKRAEKLKTAHEEETIALQNREDDTLPVDTQNTDGEGHRSSENIASTTGQGGSSGDPVVSTTITGATADDPNPIADISPAHTGHHVDGGGDETPDLDNNLEEKNEEGSVTPQPTPGDGSLPVATGTLHQEYIEFPRTLVYDKDHEEGDEATGVESWVQYDEYWPFEETDGKTPLITFAPPLPAPDGLEAPEIAIPTGVLRCMGYTGEEKNEAGEDDEGGVRWNALYVNESLRRERLGVRPLDLTERDENNVVKIHQGGYEQIFKMLAPMRNAIPEPEYNRIMQDLTTGSGVRTVTVGDDTFEWSLVNEIVLRDIIGQLTFAMKFTKLIKLRPGSEDYERDNDFWKSGTNYDNERLGVVKFTDSKKIIDEKKLATVFADWVPRLETVKALTKNSANTSMIAGRPRYANKYFEMCYQGGIEAVVNTFNRLSSKTKKSLEGGGTRASALKRDLDAIKKEIRDNGCTEFQLQGVMETAVMKVIATLEADYNWHIQPSRQRMAIYARNNASGAGLRRLTGLSAARGWGKTFRNTVTNDAGDVTDVFGDGNHRVGLPMLGDNSGQNPSQSEDESKPQVYMHGTFGTGSYRGLVRQSEMLQSPVAHRRPGMRGYVRSQEINSDDGVTFLSPAHRRPSVSPLGTPGPSLATRIGNITPPNEDGHVSIGTNSPGSDVHADDTSNFD